MKPSITHFLIEGLNHENTLLEVDENGNMVAITMEHASKRADVSNLSVSGIAA